MHRTALLIVCLSLVLMAFVPLSTPVAAQECGTAQFPQGDVSFADAVVSFAPVTTPDGVPSDEYLNPQLAMGPPDYAGTFEDQVVTLGSGGQLTVQFLDNAVTGDGAASPDLWIFEVGDDVEDTFVEVSQDGSTWVPVGKVTGGTCGIDLDAYGFGPQSRFSFVRLTDDPTEGEATGARSSTPGADIDAVGAISTVRVSPPQTQPQGTAAECSALLAARAQAPILTGPFRGPLEQSLGDITYVRAGTTVETFAATATLVNPTDGSTVPWDYGFAFHEVPDRGAVQQLFVDSSGIWYYASYPMGVLESGAAPSFDPRPGATNTLDLAVADGTARFCVNGQLAATVSLPPAVASEVYVATGLLEGNRDIVEGRVINYGNFTVWALPVATAQMPPPTTCQWTGTWDTEFGPMRLSQSGASVSGDYDWDQGLITGTVSGNVLRGTWNEAPSRQPPTDAGEVELTMRDDCQSFTGRWRYGSSEAWRIGWFGQRVSN
jgi:hypothetical protein